MSETEQNVCNKLTLCVFDKNMSQQYLISYLMETIFQRKSGAKKKRTIKNDIIS